MSGHTPWREIRRDKGPAGEPRVLRLMKDMEQEQREWAQLHDAGCDGENCNCRTIYRVEVTE